MYVGFGAARVLRCSFYGLSPQSRGANNGATREGTVAISLCCAGGTVALLMQIERVLLIVAVQVKKYSSRRRIYGEFVKIEVGFLGLLEGCRVWMSDKLTLVHAVRRGDPTPCPVSCP